MVETKEVLSNYDISLLQFLFWKNAANLKEREKKIEKYNRKRSFIEWMAVTRIANYSILLKKGMTTGKNNRCK